MNLKYVEEINKRIFGNFFYFWLYFLFGCFTTIYILILYFNISFLGVPETHKFILLDFIGLNFILNLTLIIAISICLFLFISGVISSIVIFNRIKYIYSYNKSYAAFHLFNSFFTISIIWIFFYQISFSKLLSNHLKFISSNRTY